MGAQFDTVGFAATNDNELRLAFMAHQDSLLNEYGSGAYQGHLGLKDGLHIDRREPFEDAFKANEYLEDHPDTQDKWSGPAVAVRYKVKVGKDKLEEAVVWMVGGWCPS